ncbi:MAG: fatty acid desaturase [Candidatus Omnitrophota bacterium]|nr:fatty acid desaturase [Candidatus Omnitrophota bacterium]
MSGQALVKKSAKPHWVPLCFIAAIHILAIGAIFNFTWSALFLCVALHWVTGGLGITLCYHRLLTHRSFQASKFVEYILTFFATLACQGGPISWVAAHRLHHANSDEELDPHSPVHGFFWAHMGWCMSRNKTIDDYNEYKQYAPDLAKDPVHRFLNSYHMLSTLLLAIALYAWGGLPFLTWGIFARTVFVYHSTWFVNSAAHVWGYQTFKTGERSKNLWWVALMTYGEGWHNNHHAFQTSARHGLKWWEIDTTYWMIKVLEFFRLAKAVKVPTERAIANTYS